MITAQHERLYRLELYHQGLTDDELSTELCLSKSAIQKWRYRTGNLKANRPKLTLDDAIDRADGQMLEWLEELKERREKDGVR